MQPGRNFCQLGRENLGQSLNQAWGGSSAQVEEEQDALERSGFGIFVGRGGPGPGLWAGKEGMLRGTFQMWSCQRGCLAACAEFWGAAEGWGWDCGCSCAPPWRKLRVWGRKCRDLNPPKCGTGR